MAITLEERFKKFKSMKFPSPPASDSLADWIFDYILELDGYFAGIFSRIQNQEEIDLSVLRKLEHDIITSIEMAPRAHDISYVDRKVYHHFLGYLNLMLEITKEALEHKNKN